MASSTSAPQLWSKPSTWPEGVVPGVGSAVGANVTIPCGQVVILDVANVTLSLLRVQGLLKSAFSCLVSNLPFAMH